jgi:CRP-like cAMP-binding protein
MNLLLQEIARYVTLDPKEQELLLSFMELKKYKAKTILLREGEICNYGYFINKGIIRSYVLDRNNKEFIFRLANAGNWISSYKSFQKQIPSVLYIEVIEDAEVIQINFENLNLLYQVIPKMELYFGIKISEHTIEFSDRILDNMTLTAEENYLKFVEKFPNIANRITQKHIASYIGVTAAFFSRMKIKMLKK